MAEETGTPLQATGGGSRLPNRVARALLGAGVLLFLLLSPHNGALAGLAVLLVALPVAWGAGEQRPTLGLPLRFPLLALLATATVSGL